MRAYSMDLRERVLGDCDAGLPTKPVAEKYKRLASLGASAKAAAARDMDGRGRALDNVFIERLWRSVKYEEVYLRDYADGWEVERRLARYFQFYCEERIHQSLAYRTPAAVYGRKE